MLESLKRRHQLPIRRSYTAVDDVSSSSLYFVLLDFTYEEHTVFCNGLQNEYKSNIWNWIWEVENVLEF